MSFEKSDLRPKEDEGFLTAANSCLPLNLPHGCTLLLLIIKEMAAARPKSQMSRLAGWLHPSLKSLKFFTPAAERTTLSSPCSSAHLQQSAPLYQVLVALHIRSRAHLFIESLMLHTTAAQRISIESLKLSTSAAEHTSSLQLCTSAAECTSLSSPCSSAHLQQGTSLFQISYALHICSKAHLSIKSLKLCTSAAEHISVSSPCSSSQLLT